MILSIRIISVIQIKMVSDIIRQKKSEGLAVTKRVSLMGP